MANGDDVPAGSVDTEHGNIEHADDTNTDGPGDLGREGDAVPKEEDDANSVSFATDETCTADSTSDSCEVSTDEDDDVISQSTPIARPNLSKTRPTYARLPAKTGKKMAGGAGKQATAVVAVASSSRGAAVPPDRFVTEEATTPAAGGELLPPVEIRQHDAQQHLADSNDDDGDGVSAISNPDHWTVASGSTGTGGSSSLSYMDAYFRRHVRSATPPRTAQRRNGTEGIPAISVPAESDGSTPVGFRFTIPGTGSRNIAIPATESDEFMSLDFRIPGAYAVYPDPNDAGGDHRGMHADAQGRRLSDQTLPTTNTLRGSSDQTMPVTNTNAMTNIGIGIGIGIGTERTTHHGDAMSEPLDPVYRLTEAAVVDDDVVVEAHPVDEDSDLAAHLERHVSLAVEEARQKGRKQRHIVWAGLTFVVLAVAASAVSAAVSITTKGYNAIDNSAPGGGHSETAMVDDPVSVLPSLRSIVGGSSLGFLDDPNRIAALDWMSKDQISMALLQSAKGVDEIEEEVVLKLRQRYVSALIFLATNGPLWYARLGFLSHKDECDWNKAILGDASAGEVTDFGGAVEAKGLFCNEEGRIQRISLWWNGLSGTLPSELAFLSDSLEGINLAGGSISGTVPSSFGNLAKLKELSLSEHCLTGKLPESLSSLNRLEIVNFFANDHLSGSLNALCKNDVINWFAADCGDCPGSESHVRCDCCVCCENSSFTCCDKEGTKLYSWMNLAKNPITHRPLSFDRPCLSKESLAWKERECPCVVYGKSGGICSTDCDGNTLLQDTLKQVSSSFP